MKLSAGRVVAPQGIKGQVRIKTDLTDVQLLLQSTPLKITHAKLHKPGLVVAQIDAVTDRNTAETLRGTELFIDRDQLPETDAPYQIDLIGRDVLHAQTLQKIGKLTAIYDFGAGSILEITPHLGETILLPLTCVVDGDATPLLVEIPETI